MFRQLNDMTDSVVMEALQLSEQDKLAGLSCPACFGPQPPNSDQYPETTRDRLIICLDGNFQHRHHMKASRDESFVVRGNLLDGLVVPSCFPRCHPLSPPRTPRVTPPTPVGPGTPPAAPKQVSHRRFRLWSAPNPASAPRCSPLLVAPPQYTLNLRSAVGRDPRRPPMPGFPAPAYVASAPRAFRISAASIPHAPNKPAKALVKARSRHHTADIRAKELEHQPPAKV
ncbi:hypothetical protein PGTUg99_025125 [Puccinia graminis f. sp. tritici]|uniref:Uncharacterized protein n=1 Tax=Puccinia graminis f. sp. tritici TaxID=56615 RepID=A0A5B0QMD6_PUCGR|nr:hypothetical protein PGTUg99_025125 [Puccinia graminis f. sp. tritici]